MISSHDINNPDPYIKPVFSSSNKLKRYCWNVAWLLLCRWTPNPLHNWRIFILRSFGGKIGNQNFVYPDCRIWAPWLLTTEDVVTIGPSVEIYNPGGVEIGHHTILSQDAYICGATHNYNEQDFTYIKKAIIIEAYVWICAKAIILPGICCMEGSVLGAGAVIGKNMEAWTVYTGNPAVAIKKRNNFLLKEQ